MQLHAAQLEKHLAAKLAELYVVVGDEPLGQTECLDAIRLTARQAGAEERSSFIVERNFNWQQVQQFGQALSLFASKRILEIHIPSGKPGTDGATHLTEIAQQGIPDTTIIIVLPTLERDAKNSAWFSALQNKATVIEVNEVAPQQLPQWIAERLGRQYQSADTPALAFMAHQVEGNLLAAHQEIQKLGLLYPAGTLSETQIREAVLNVSRHDAFQLGEAVLAGDPARATRILQGLQEEGEQPVAVMNPLIWLLRPLLRLKQAEARGENMQQAFSNARIFGDRQVLVKKALMRFNARQIEAALQKLCDIDRIAKGVMQGDAWLELSRLCFGLAKLKAR